MKSVDRDYAGNGYAQTYWFFAYSLLVLGTIGVFIKLWKGIYLHGLSSDIVFQNLSFTLLFIIPLIFALLFRRYIRSALKENLVSERVAENCEYWIGRLISSVYVAFILYALFFVIV